MDMFIATGVGILVGFCTGLVIAWKIQQKKVDKMEKGFEEWQEREAINIHGVRIHATVKNVSLIRGTNKYRIAAQWQSPNTRDRYPFQERFYVKNNSAEIVQKLRNLKDVDVLVVFGDTPQQYMYYMERRQYVKCCVKEQGLVELEMPLAS